MKKKSFSLSPSFRVSRWNFFKVIIWSLPLAIILWIIGGEFHDGGSSLGGLMMIFSAIAFFFATRITNGRLHDMGFTGWLSLFLFIPLINLIFVFILLISEGDELANHYGEPEKRSLSTLILLRD